MLSHTGKNLEDRLTREVFRVYCLHMVVHDRVESESHIPKGLHLPSGCNIVIFAFGTW